MPRPSLTLYAANDRIVTSELIDLLKSNELIGESIASGEFLVGSKFFSHITFLGCAPNIAIDPKQGPQHIRIAIPALSKPALFAGSRALAPLCPACKQALEHWEHHVGTTQNDAFSCPGCNVTTPLRHLNFRKRACFAKHVIHISPVFEGEAMPSDGLIDTLNEVLDAHFSYAFIG